ncbi:predicted protein [Nematostella vectensis]|uniref:ALOG domain-containing protein n=1 Tax=Nematostella vectensis TaxID=45351 RepID=A7SZW8_NEMVE|nr:predicted protein [Nematostella vectensis]|eukprot:XP_001622849.1 hypothetical protein NEMVEDRAFT_v1g220156 [Nematostella vectensis]
MAAFITCSVLLDLGYFIGLKKSVLEPQTKPSQADIQTRGYWNEAEWQQPIAEKEALALLFTLENLLCHYTNVRVVYTDNKVLLGAWQRQVSKSAEISSIIKRLFAFTFAKNLALVLYFVPSRNNPADSPSRVLSDLDCTLSAQTWRSIDIAFGPHSIDLMALPSNVMHDHAGRPLRFFSQLPCVQAESTNVFAHSLLPEENAYVFPPFILMGPLLGHLSKRACPFSIVVPDITPRKYWWSVLKRRAAASFKLGSRGSLSSLLFPAKSGAAPWLNQERLRGSRAPFNGTFGFSGLSLKRSDFVGPSRSGKGMGSRGRMSGVWRREKDKADTQKKINIDLPFLDRRLESLTSSRNNKPYQKRTSSLLKELERFLDSLTPPKNLMSASPRDINRFLVWKDEGGRTKIHKPTCTKYGSAGSARCRCPSRLAAGTVDSIIGKLRAIFAEAGRKGEWNEMLNIGNPSSHRSAKGYLTSIREEQAMAHVSPKQATPIFFDKLAKLCRFLRNLVFVEKATSIQRHIHARDLAFFCLDFFAGDRASGLGRVLTKEALASKDGETIWFRHTYGSTIANRLKLHLGKADILEGETMHGFRSGCSITLSLLRVSTEDVARHVGWKSTSTADYYSQTGKVMNAERVADALAESSVPNATGETPALSLAADFTTNNRLGNLSLAFP